jgi:dTDP-L-rhamnose 4-epimerase
MRVLVTGGAGFVGSHTVDALIERGYEVRILDSLDPQVHRDGRPPAWLNPRAELVRAEITDREAVRAALAGVERVVHLAAAVGVGQSMYAVRRYVHDNSLGAATLLDVLANDTHTVRRMVVASSMSIYGEGAYRCGRCGPVAPPLRPEAQLRQGAWEVLCPRCSVPTEPVPTGEDKPLQPTSIYAITKRDHEEMFLAVGRAYGIATVALRYFNVYGPRQSLSNPYTGVAAIFASRLLNGRAPMIFEDGRQSRDFVHVSDIARANLLALERSEADFGVFNIGTGRPTTVLQIAEALAAGLGSSLEPEVLGRCRAGDIRHCFADVSKISGALGFEADVPLAHGMRQLVDWLRSQPAEDMVDGAQGELEARRLIR